MNSDIWYSPEERARHAQEVWGEDRRKEYMRSQGIINGLVVMTFVGIVIWLCWLAV